MHDVLGQAIFDFYNNTKGNAKLWIHNKYGPKEDMPVETYFRDKAYMPKLEHIALGACYGKVLDIGAGAGRHTLVLQEMGLDVTAFDISPKAAETMRLRGVKDVVVDDIFLFDKEKFDTLLMLMNGIGLVGNIENLRRFLQHAKKLLLPGGQLLCDSSDVAYLYEGNMPGGNYYGQIAYNYHYKGKSSGWFSWLYIDKKLFAQIAQEEGWHIKIISEDAFNQYLAKLWLHNP